MLLLERLAIQISLKLSNNLGEVAVASKALGVGLQGGDTSVT